MITVTIDELTPCLIENETGDIKETEVIQIKRKSFLEKYNDKTGWYEICQKKGTSVPELSDEEKNLFINGATIKEVREKAIKL